jgi:hypothetical protein
MALLKRKFNGNFDFYGFLFLLEIFLINTI